MNTFILVLVGAALAALLGRALHWAFWPHGMLPRNRVRHQRIRLQLRLHPGRGHATVVELFAHWGRWASARKAKYARPTMPLLARLRYPAEHSIRVGRAQYWHSLRVPIEEHVVVDAPPRTGKTGWLSSVILRYPGAVVSTSTRADVATDTGPWRSQLGGQVDVFNPQGIGRVPSTMSFDVIDGCLDVATAVRRADAFAFAVSSAGMEDGAFWSAKTSDYLRALFYAAAYARQRGYHYGMARATRWALTDQSREAEEILQDAGAGDWSAQVGELRGEAQKTAQTVRMYMSRCLAFMLDPALARSVTPADGDVGLNLESFVRKANTLYLIASGQGENSPLAPLFACITSEIHYTAGLVGSWSRGSRLPRPLLFALDEVTQICPVPLDKWMADSGGKGVQVIAVTHGVAQLRERWGTNGARTILDCASAEIALPGIKDPETLKHISTVCGTVTMKEHGAERYSQHPILTEAMIREMPDKRALVIRTNRAPVICRIRQVWDDKPYKVTHGQRSLYRRLVGMVGRRPRLSGAPIAALLPSVNPSAKSTDEAA